jgi:hypothetical protein
VADSALSPRRDYYWKDGVLETAESSDLNFLNSLLLSTLSLDTAVVSVAPALLPASLLSSYAGASPFAGSCCRICPPSCSSRRIWLESVCTASCVALTDCSVSARSLNFSSSRCTFERIAVCVHARGL